MSALSIGYLAEELSSAGGTSRYARSLVEAVSVHATVRVLTKKGAHNDTILSGVRSVLPAPRFYPLAQIQVAFQVIRYFRGCDVIHSLIEHYGPGAAFAAHVLGIPATLTLHGTYSVPPAEVSFKQQMMRYMFKRMPLTTSGSIYTVQKVEEVVPLKECRIIPNGVNLERFRVLPGVEKEDLIITVGALKARKGVDVTLRALAELKDKYPSLQYAVVGDDDHDSFSRNAHELVRTSGLEGRVTFYEKIPDETLVKMYNRAKVFVLAARTTTDGAFEGFPMVFYEANGCGTPVITTSGFGSEYAIHDGENGFVVPPENPHAVAQAIEHLFADTERYDTMKAQALFEASEHTWKKIGTILISFYHDVINVKP